MQILNLGIFLFKNVKKVFCDNHSIKSMNYLHFHRKIYTKSFIILEANQYLECAIRGCPLIYFYFITFIIFLFYNLIMRMKMSDFAKKFRTIVGDSTLSCPDEFIINAVNWAFNELPLAPKLDKVFSKNYRKTLKPGHYRWNLADHKDFRRLTNLPVFTLWTSTGGNLCPLKVCAVTPEELYAESVPSMMQQGRPCKMALEQEDDEVYLVFDRPIDEPIILQYTAYGFPTNVSSMDDEIKISAVVENALLDVMRVVWYREADDLAFAGAAYDYLDNKYIPQMTQMINKKWHGVEGHTVLGV